MTYAMVDEATRKQMAPKKPSGAPTSHLGKKPAEALGARDLDMDDAVMGRPPVVRCRVCYKPCETGVHPARLIFKHHVTHF